MFTRCPGNPIVRPGRYPWRMATVFNPGVIHDGGRFLMLERAAGGLRPFHCCLGLLASDDGVRFTHVKDEPVFTPAMAGSPHGSVQDPRVVIIEGTFYMTYAFRPYAWNSHPTGVGVPESYQAEFPGFSGDPADNKTRTGIAASADGVTWEHRAWATPRELDDRDVILFPEKVNGRYALLRRPAEFVGAAYGTDTPSIWLCFSDDLVTWSEPALLAKPEERWESGRIGGSTPPIRTREGWLLFYHGVENVYPPHNRVVYRLGAMLLDLDDPRRVIARTKGFLMEPEAYYEKVGLYIPNVIFPTGAVVMDGTVHLYYGVTDTAIALATAPLDAVVERVRRGTRLT
jgi:predicted GH43/DUF377 family glycosyl hydrolase